MERSFSKLLLSMFMIAVLFTACHKDQVFNSVVADGAKPTSVFTYTPSAANALIVTFNNTSANVQSVYWQFGDGSTSTDNAPVHTYAAAGKYTVILKTTSTAGYSATSTQTVTAIPAAVASFSVASQFELGVAFNNTSTTVASVAWDFGDGSASTTLSPQHRYTTAGNYNVKLTVTGLLGDVISTTQSVAVQNSNLLKGGGFEAATNSYWKAYSGMVDITPVYGYTGDGPAGGYDACLRFPSFTGGAGLNGLIYQGVNVVAGKQYKLSAVVKLPAGGKNDYLQLYISKDPTVWIESTTDPNANFFLALNNYHSWGTTSSSTVAINGDLYAATLTNGQYGLGVVTKGIYTATFTGTIYIGIQAGLYAGASNGDLLVDNVNFVQVN